MISRFLVAILHLSALMHDAQVLFTFIKTVSLAKRHSDTTTVSAGMQEHIDSSFDHDASKGKVFHTRQLACPTFSSHKASICGRQLLPANCGRNDRRYALCFRVNLLCTQQHPFSAIQQHLYVPVLNFAALAGIPSP